MSTFYNTFLQHSKESITFMKQRAYRLVTPCFVKKESDCSNFPPILNLDEQKILHLIWAATSKRSFISNWKSSATYFLIVVVHMKWRGVEDTYRGRPEAQVKVVLRTFWLESVRSMEQEHLQESLCLKASQS